MQSHHATSANSSLPEGKKLQLQSFLAKEFFNAKDIAAIEKQLAALLVELNDVRDVNEIRSLSSFIAIIKLIIELANNVLEYVAIQEISISSHIRKPISNLKSKLEILLSKNIELTKSFEEKEELHQKLVSSPSLRLVDTHAEFFRSRSAEDLNIFTKDITSFRKVNEKLLIKIAVFSNNFIKENILLDHFEGQLAILGNADVAFYATKGVEALTQQKTKISLDGFMNAFRRWKEMHKMELSLIVPTYALVKNIGTLHSELRKHQMLEAYPQLAGVEVYMERFMPNAIKVRLRVSNVMGVLVFADKIDRLYELQLDKIRTNQQLTYARSHMRERSKSTNDSIRLTPTATVVHSGIYKTNPSSKASTSKKEAPARDKHKSLMVSSRKKHVYKRSMSQGQLLFSLHIRKNEKGDDNAKHVRRNKKGMGSGAT